ncbi:hypothetical protein BKA65DRAFT_196276 [Rhexocercosporidium sp. MPI-PUGE-AT-0058]|nr:hypothetical protein BKA65DRAFT_196276 [Rhexocercosporidium sp. MPI-PUGE-AT-0058]
MEYPSIYPSPPTMEARDFEWNVFENQQQFLNWHSQPPTSHATISLTNTSFRSPTSYATSSTHHTEMESPSQSPGSSVAGEKSEDLDFSGVGCKKAPTKRRIQNRKAQRAFRLRQKMHVESLEERLKSLVGEYEELQQRYTCLSVEYEKVIGVGVGSGKGSSESEWMGEDDVILEGLEDCEGEKDDDNAEKTEAEIKREETEDKMICVDWRSGEKAFVESAKGICLHDFLLSDGWVA